VREVGAGTGPRSSSWKRDLLAIIRHGCTAEQSDDLAIRTRAELQLDGFRPRLSSHREFSSTDLDRPAFGELDYLRTVGAFQPRERCFGR
jgi:undecaprenyl pyrophosphate synthase